MFLTKLSKKIMKKRKKIYIMIMKINKKINKINIIKNFNKSRKIIIYYSRIKIKFKIKWMMKIVLIIIFIIIKWRFKKKCKYKNKFKKITQISKMTNKCNKIILFLKIIIYIKRSFNQEILKKVFLIHKL